VNLRKLPRSIEGSLKDSGYVIRASAGAPDPNQHRRAPQTEGKTGATMQTREAGGAKAPRLQRQKKNGHDPDPVGTSFIVPLRNQTKRAVRLGFEGLGEEDDDGFSAGAGEGDLQVTGVFDFAAKLAVLIGDGFDDAAAAI
jgi:hypothetical protein